MKKTTSSVLTSKSWPVTKQNNKRDTEMTGLRPRSKMLAIGSKKYNQTVVHVAYRLSINKVLGYFMNNFVCYFWFRQVRPKLKNILNENISGGIEGRNWYLSYNTVVGWKETCTRQVHVVQKMLGKKTMYVSFLNTPSPKFYIKLCFFWKNIVKMLQSYI